MKHSRLSPAWISKELMFQSKLYIGVYFVLRSLCAQAQVHEAFQSITCMDQQGPHVSIKTIYWRLRECINNKDFAEGMEVYCLIRRHGFDSNTVLGGHLIHLFVLCGKLSEANQVFSKLSKPNLITWSAIISANAKLGQTEVAINLYHQMQKSRIKPNARVFAAVLKACSCVPALDQGKLFHGHIIEIGCVVDIFTANPLIDMYAKCGSLEDARNVFDKLAKRDVVTWNSMITGYTQTGCGEEALRLFQAMHREGFEPDKVTFICTLKACASVGARDLGKLVHAYIIERGLQLNVCVGNTLIDMYSKCGQIEDARIVFDILPNKTVVSWNAMIAGYAQHGHGQEAFGIFYKMQQRCMEPNNATRVSILKACSSIVDLDQGQLIHSLVIESGSESDVCIGSMIIDMYTKCGSLDDACRVFDKLPKRDMVIWTAMIAGYVHNGYGDKALHVFEHMQQLGIEANDVTCISVLKACSSTASLHQGRLIHNHIKASTFGLDSCVGNALIDMYAKCGSLEDARRVFDKLPKRSLVTWNTMIAGNNQHGEGDEALFLFQQMLKEGFKPNNITFLCILRACSSISALAQGKLIHAHIIESDSEVNMLVGNTLVDMYVKCGSVEDACKLFDKSSKQDIVVWSAMIAGYAQRGDYKLALQVFEDMQQEGLKPNDVTFVCLLSACNRAGLVDAGFHHFQSMKRDYGIAPTFEHYNCMVDLLGRVGCLIEAELLLLTMPFEPNLVVLTSLLSHCKTHGNVELGKRCFEFVNTTDIPQASAYVLMLNIYTGAGMCEDAYKISELRACSCAWKKPGQAFTELENEVQEFVVGDMSPQKTNLYTKLNRLNMVMIERGYVPLMLQVEEEQEDTFVDSLGI